MTNKKKSPGGCLRVLSWIGLVLALFLIGAAVWFHYHLDAVIRIPFVFIFGGGGVLLGFSCLIYILKGKFTGMVGPFS